MTDQTKRPDFARQAGVVYAAAAYLIWGFAPVYFKILRAVPVLEILVQRMVWSLAFLLIALVVLRRTGWLARVWREPRVLAVFTASAIALSVNWLVYIWAVNSNRVVDASLGYFINPLLSVMLGFIVLHERLRAAQWAAVGLTALGVAWLTWQAHELPWVGLALAAAFAVYGLLRKTAPLGALEGLSLETLLLFPLAGAYLVYLGLDHRSAFAIAPTSTQWWLAAAGPITAVPLLLFAAGARRIPLSLLGLLQYIAPTLQLVIGVWLYGEPFSGPKLIGYVMIWAALLAYSLEGYWYTRNRAVTAPAGI